MVLIKAQMEAVILGSGNMMTIMDKGGLNFIIKIYLKDSGRTGRRMDLDIIITQTGISIKVNGRPIKEMVLGF